MALSFSTESLARASARRPWFVVGTWATVIVASAIAIGALLASGLTSEVSLTNDPESQRAEDLLENRLRGPEPTNEIVIVRSPDATVGDPEFRAFVEELYGKVSALGTGVVASGTNFYQSNDRSLVSEDGRTTILPFVMTGKHEDAQDNIGEVLNIVEERNGVDGFQVLITGGASINDELDEQAQKDLETGESIGIPIALLVLILVFGSLIAAGIPLVLGILAIIVAVGISALIGQAFQLSFFITNVITMMGLAVGIDYSLFIVSRYREERNRGLEKMDAIAATGETANRAVFFSGMTVVLALFGMLLVPSTIFRSLGAGAIVVVLVSVAISLTLLPAMLGLLGDKVNALKVPFIGRGAVEADHERRGGFWYTVTRIVMRYPVISVVASAGLLIALALPYLNITIGSAGISTLPETLQSRQGFEILRDEFSFGLVNPAEIAIEGDVNGAQVQGGIDRLDAILAEHPEFSPGTFTANDDGTVALYSVPINGDTTSNATLDSVRALRREYIPQAFSGVNAKVLVGGDSAGAIDYINTTNNSTPIVFAFVLTLSFVLLTIVFRSIVVPIKAIIMNLLSVGAAYGILVLVFQEGWGNELLGFQQVDIIEAWVPLWTFSILFGLSMDYHVFLLSRIRERFDKTANNRESVAFGVRSTAGIITGAALIMAAVFMGIAMGDLVMFQQMGFGLAIAVLLDATIVRSVLVPAAMELLGDRNWYLPSFLNWLPDLREREAKEAAVAIQNIRESQKRELAGGVETN
jgi:putative drug exporter of the RND superfamily